MMDRQFYGKIILRGKIRAVTGLHIGTQKEVSEIGGIDNPIIKHPHTGLPYIPGSSLKGKLRSLLEILTNSNLQNWSTKYPTLLKYQPGSCRPQNQENCGKFFNKRINKGWIHVCPSYEDAYDCPVCRLFGASGDNTNFPSRVIVRDAFLTKEWEDNWRKGMDITEAKTEVGIDRVTSQANPRTTERVVAGAEFEFEIIYTVEDPEQWRDDFVNLLTSMAILEDNYLGGSGSRGYGKVKFILEDCEFRSPDYYKGATEPVKLDIKDKEVKEVLQNADSILGEVKIGTGAK